MTAPHATVSDYLAALPESARPVAEAMREAIRRAAPGCTEAMKYGIVAFLSEGNTFLYLGMWKKHAGLYPVYRGDSAFEEAVAPFRSGKDSVRFALGKPVPMDIVRRIAAAQFSRRTGG